MRPEAYQNSIFGQRSASTKVEPDDFMAPAQCHSMELRMHILWTIIIGFVAGVIAKLIHSGPNEPTGFILTTISWHRRRVRRDIPRAGDRPVSCRRRGWVL